MINFAFGRFLFIEINVNYSWTYNFEDIQFINIDASIMAFQGFYLIKSKTDVATFLMPWSAHIRKLLYIQFFSKNYKNKINKKKNSVPNKRCQESL